MDIISTIRTIPDFPKQGIMFRDITTMLKDKRAFAYCVDRMAEHYQDARIDKVVGIESRGFILGSVLAYKLGAGFVPVRKPNKLPAKKLRAEYALEYGTDCVEIHVDAIEKGDRILMQDDLLATGGTMTAACSLVEELGGTIAGLSFIIELSFLNPRARLGQYDIFSLVQYDKE
jgi:adenine phosphoribosyltransferase